MTLFAAQLLFSRWWLAHHRYGPVEWQLRAVTLGSLPKWKGGSMTARLWPARGLDPADPDALLPVVAVDPEGEPAERAVARLCHQGYEGDECLYLVRTDGWAERHRSDDGTLTVSVAAYPDGLLAPGDAEPADRSRHPRAVLLLTVSAPVPAHAYARLARATGVVVAEGTRSLGDIEADLATGVLWPLVLAPPPPAE